MNSNTERAIIAVLEIDPTVTSEQRRSAIDLLRGRTPQHTFPTPQSPLLTRQQTETLAVSKSTEKKVYLRRREAAKYLGCCVRQIDALKHDGDLPFYRLGRRLIVFRLSDLESLMAHRRIEATDLDAV
jgi:excisionase family DNA binding protein